LKAYNTVKQDLEDEEHVQGKGIQMAPENQQKHTPLPQLLLLSHGGMHQQTWQLHMPTQSGVRFQLCLFIY